MSKRHVYLIDRVGGIGAVALVLFIGVPLWLGAWWLGLKLLIWALRLAGADL